MMKKKPKKTEFPKGLVFKISVFFLFFLAILPIISATNPQKGVKFDLKIPFEVNGTIPSASAWCNVSINYPNGTYLKQNASTTNLLNGDFNITLISEEISELGTHEWRAFCCDNGLCAAGYGDFYVTPSGQDRINSGEGISLFGSILSMIIVAIFFFAISSKFEGGVGKIIFISLSAIVLIMVILFTLVILTQNLGGFSTLIEGYSTFWFVMKIIVSLGVLSLIIFALLIAVKLWKYKRGFID